MKTLLTLLALLLPVAAVADCTTPAAPAGKVIFNTTTKTMQYCNGTDWVNTGASVPAASQTGCSSPAGTAGTVTYNGTLGVIQFCNGENWVDTACAADRTLGGPGCTGSPAGTIRYASTPNELQFCDSTNWVAMGWGCSGSAGSQTGLIDWSLAQQTQKLNAADAISNAYFGYSVAISGNTAIVGTVRQNSYTGAAYIFTRSGNTWTQQQKLTASDAATGDYYGVSVAIDGNTAVVGANRKSSNNGAIYIYTRSGGVWSEQANIPAPGISDFYFGTSVAISGETIVVGAKGDSSETGDAHIYVRSGSTWSRQQGIWGSDQSVGDGYGNTVDIDGDTVVVGASFKNSITGSAYVYTRSGTTWTQQTILTPAETLATNSYFGHDVAIDGNTILVSSIGQEAGGYVRGAVYVFKDQTGSWAQEAKLTASNAADFDSFGESVDISGNDAIIGSSTKNSYRGSAYIFNRSGTTWTEKTILVPSDVAANDYFGFAVAIENDAALITSHRDDDSVSNSGSTYFFKAQ